jgi:hypothetical protein
MLCAHPSAHQQTMTDTPPRNPELVRPLAALVRSFAGRAPDAVAQRGLVKEIAAAVAAGAVSLAPGTDDLLLVDGAPVAVPDDDTRLLAGRLDACGVEEFTITPRAATADLYDLGRLLGAGGEGEAAASRFASGATVLDAKSLPRRLRPREVPVSTEKALPTSAAVAPTPAARRIPTPRQIPAVQPVAQPAAAHDELREPAPIPATKDPRLAAIIAALAEPAELAALRRRLDILVNHADLAFRGGRDADLVEALTALVAIEYAQLQHDGSDERRQAFAHGIRRLARPVLLRRLAVLRHRMAGDATAVTRLQSVLHRYGTDGVEALVDEFSAAPTSAARAACLMALRELPRAYDVLFAICRGGGNVAVRDAAEILAALEDPPASELLLELLHHADVRARRSAVAALAADPRDEAFDAVCFALQDEEPMVRARAVAALTDRRDVRAVARLTPLVAKEPDREVLYATIAALGVLGGTDAVQTLVRCAEGEGEHPLADTAAYRIHACTALVAIRTPVAMACVQRLHRDRDREVRGASLRLVAQAQRRTTGSQEIVSAP